MRPGAASPSSPAAVPASRLHRWWLGRSVRAKGLVVVAVPLVALVGVTSASLALQGSERQERAGARAAFAFITATNQVLADAVNAETGVRGYAATSEPLFLAPYDLALARLAGDRRSLRNASIAERDAIQQRAIDVTAGRAFLELAQIRSAVSHGVTATKLKPALVNGKATMDLLRRQIASIVRGPTAVYSNGRNGISALESDIDELNLAGLILGILAGLVGVALFTSGISRRVVAAADNADRLGQGQPLEAVLPSGDELGRLAASLVLAEQLLARRAAELTAARDEALQATQAKNAFLANTCHELRTPLNSILGFAQLLELSEIAGEDRDSVERILGAGRHLLALINELIDISRIESGDLSLSVEPVPLLPLVEKVARLMDPLAAERSVAIGRACSVPSLAVLANRQRLSQVLVNLISNAIKYNRRGGSITVTCRADGDAEATIMIADTGPGLTRDDLERVFVPFERLGADRSGTEGSGIGLPLARGLAEAMGGRLNATSVPGEGSVFAVSLQRAPDVVQVPPDEESSTEPAVPRALSGTTIHVLYIVDNPANVELVSRYLNGRGDAKLGSVASGRAGVESALRDVPDIVLLDLQLGDVRGEQVLAELRAEPATAAVPVVILSAEASTGTVRRVLAGGAVAYLTKPLSLAELGELLDSLLPAAGPVP